MRESRSWRPVAANVPCSRDAPHDATQFGAQHRKGGRVRDAFRAHDEIDRGQRRERVASENLPYAAPQTIAGHRAELEAGDDDPRPRVAHSIRAPGDIEVRSTPPAPLIPAGGEVRAARPQTVFIRARKPCLLTRRRLRGRYDGPINFPREAGKRTPLSRARSRLTFPHAGRSFGPPLLDVPPLRHSWMEQSTKEAWRRLLDEARRELPDATVRTWLEPAVPIALDD